MNEKTKNRHIERLDINRAEVGMQVAKLSGKPFKSGNTIGTIKEIVVHPITKKDAVVLVEDSTVVEMLRLYSWK